MKSEELDPARTFRVGVDQEIEISHCANVTLEPDEQVTFVTNSGTQYDVARKSWGYYATPSTNGRLAQHNLRTALVCNSGNQLYVMLCETGKENEFESYLKNQDLQLVTWLDTNQDVLALKAALR